jgi:lysine/ornithine N-monooxygenase
VNEKGYRLADTDSQGNEIAREVLVCTACAKKLPPARKSSEKPKVIKSAALRKRKPRFKRSGED